MYFLIKLDDNLRNPGFVSRQNSVFDKLLE